MSRYKDSNKYKIYGEDAILAARFDKYLDATLRNCRADYLKALNKRKQREIPYEDLPDAEKETVQESSAADNEIESLLFWEALKTHLHLYAKLFLGKQQNQKAPFYLPFQIRLSAADIRLVGRKNVARSM